MLQDMEFDLAEYDQVEEINLLMDKHGQMYCDGSASKLLVTLTTSTDESNCENDFVLLPPLPKPERGRDKSQCISAPRALEHEVSNLQTNSAATVRDPDQQICVRPLTALSGNGINPFGNYQESAGESSMANDTYASKPVGLLEVSSTVLGNSNKVSELMQQIVTRSDSIYIAIPCAYCHELVSCPPSDISGWLHHMSRQHNCRVCPICNKLIGLGPRKDLTILKRHVIDHLDEEWLERRTIKASFTFGLQQQWFSGGRCGVKDAWGK